jgi:hypothetical protein
MCPYPDDINAIQRHLLELVRLTNHNRFQGEAVVADLLAHRALWDAV